MFQNIHSLHLTVQEIVSLWVFFDYAVLLSAEFTDLVIVYVLCLPFHGQAILKAMKCLESVCRSHLSSHYCRYRNFIPIIGIFDSPCFFIQHFAFVCGRIYLQALLRLRIAHIRTLYKCHAFHPSDTRCVWSLVFSRTAFTECGYCYDEIYAYLCQILRCTMLSSSPNNRLYTFLYSFTGELFTMLHMCLFSMKLAPSCRDF